MNSQGQSKPDKQKSEGRALRHALLLIWGMIAIVGVALILCNSNPWVLAIMVAVAGYLYNLDLHPVLTIAAGTFSAFYGLALVLILWMMFMGWLMSLGEKS